MNDSYNHSSMREKIKKLSELITSLQRSVANEGITQDVVANAIIQLDSLGFKYDHETFPQLLNTEKFLNESGESPCNLAEALLWKLGKWKSYKKFAKQYTDENATPSNTDVVFFAFAKHLKNPDNPIYDQHAIRAIWAICEHLTDKEKEKCKQLLMNTKEEWKDAGSGRTAVDCYNIFRSHINEIVKAGATKREIDLLLMPLGQAIKKLSNNYREFCALCGWNGV